MKIKISNRRTGNQTFPYGHYTTDELEFVKAFEGEVFEAERINMNYYKLKNGFMVHVYDALELRDAVVVNETKRDDKMVSISVDVLDKLMSEHQAAKIFTNIYFNPAIPTEDKYDYAAKLSHAVVYADRALKDQPI